MSHPALAVATPLWIGLAWLLTTVALYVGAKRLFLRRPRIWLSPILVTPIVLLALVLATGTTYEAYWSQSRWLTWLLGPATVAAPCDRALPADFGGGRGHGRGGGRGQFLAVVAVAGSAA